MRMHESARECMRMRELGIYSEIAQEALGSSRLLCRVYHSLSIQCRLLVQTEAGEESCLVQEPWDCWQQEEPVAGG